MPSPVSGSPPLPVAIPHAQPAVTVVVASHKYDPSSPSTQPEWMRPDARGPSPLAFFTYQRTNASRPFYSPNYGFEAGVYLQYIVEHYDALPRLTAFVQGTPAEHNRHWMAWLRRRGAAARRARRTAAGRSARVLSASGSTLRRCPPRLGRGPSSTSRPR